MKIQAGDYASLAELEEDLQRMCKNAQQFNEPGSQIFRDAKAILKLVKSKKYELEINKQARENRGSRNTRRLTGKKHFSAEVRFLNELVLELLSQTMLLETFRLLSFSTRIRRAKRVRRMRSMETIHCGCSTLLYVAIKQLQE
jgi:hypothetical protein